MSERYVYDSDEGLCKTVLSPELHAEVRKLIAEGFTYRLVFSLAESVKPCGYYLYAAAAEAVLQADKPIGVHTLFTQTGKLFGKNMAAARRCMKFATFDCDRSRQTLSAAAGLSDKAFGYLTVPEIVALIADETVCTAARRIAAREAAQ